MYNVRATVKDDWHTLKSLRLAALQDSPHAFIVTYADAIKFQDIEWRARAVQQTACHYLLALKHGEAVGMVGTIIEESNECHVVAMWIKPKYRGQGVAALLIDSVKTRIQKEGYSVLALRVAPDNKRAIRFYEKQGFKRVSTSVQNDMSETSVKMITSIVNEGMTKNVQSRIT